MVSKTSFKRGWNVYMTLLSLVGVVALFVPFDTLIGNSYALPCKIVAISIWLFVIYIITHIIVFGFFRVKAKFTRKVLITSLNKGKNLYVIFGDLLDNTITVQEETSNIVIPFNRCFDTRVDNSLISAKSLHGQIVNKLINSGKYSEETLHQKIEESLSRPWQDHYVPEIVDKKIGYNKRYPVGAVARVDGIHNERYLCFGLSKFNQETAETTKREYVEAVEHLTERIADLSQGYPVYMPLIGTGLSRTSADSKLALNIILIMIDLNRQNICSDIYIVVNPKLKESLFSMIENYE